MNKADARQAAYNARRILRASDPAKFARKHGFDKNILIMSLVEVLPALLLVECIAVAEAKAIEAVTAKMGK